MKSYSTYLDKFTKILETDNIISISFFKKEKTDKENLGLKLIFENHPEDPLLYFENQLIVFVSDEATKENFDDYIYHVKESQEPDFFKLVLKKIHQSMNFLPS